MAESFDPYRKWLAIPAEEQPPHHYRLLAIPLFESDPDVISNAADGRMSQIKSFQSGPYSKFSQQILNQISAAKICLLDTKKKAAYDRQLQQRLAPAGLPKAENGVSELAEIGSFNFATSGASSVVRPKSVKKAKPKTQPWPIYAAVGGGLIAVGAAVLFLILHQNSPGEDTHPGSNQQARADSAAKPDVKPDTKSIPLASAARKVATPAASSTAAPTKAPAARKPKLEMVADVGDERKPDTGDQVLPSQETPAEPSPQDKHDTPQTKPAGPKGLPVPEKPLQQAAEAKVREIFQQEFAAAKTNDAHAALAKKLLEQADGSKDDAAAYYVLLRMAGEQAVSGGDVPRAMEVVGKMQQHFQIDASRMKADVLAAMMRSSSLDKTAEKTAEKATAAAVFDAAMKLCDESMANDDFDLADRLAKAAAAAGRKTREPEQNRLILARTKEVDQMKGRFAAVQKALDTLGSDAADGGANLVAGQWYCFTKRNWGKGLPMLAKGDREDLAGLARQDLASPSDVKEQIALADAWWGRGEKDTAEKAALLARSRHWYELAVDKTTGLEKTRIQKRLDEDEATVVSVKPAGRQLAVDVTELPFVGNTVIDGKPHSIIIDNMDLGSGFKLTPLSLPGVTFKHIFYLHATTQFEINLEARVKSGQVAHRFRAYLYLDPSSRKAGSDGIVWTVEAGSKTRLKNLLTTPQAQDMNPVDLPLPPGTTRIMIRSLPGAANNINHDWGVMANPVVVFHK
jgi:hypothetical protein